MKRSARVAGLGKRVKIPRGPRHCHRGRLGRQSTGRERSVTRDRSRAREGARRRSIRKPGDLPDETLSRTGPHETDATSNSRSAGCGFARSRDPSCRTGGSNGDTGPAGFPRRPFPSDPPSSQFRGPGCVGALFGCATAAAFCLGRSACSHGALGFRAGLRHRSPRDLAHASDGLRDVCGDRLRRPPPARERVPGAPRGALGLLVDALLLDLESGGVGARADVPQDRGGTPALLRRGNPVLLEHAGGGSAGDGGLLLGRRSRAEAPCGADGHDDVRAPGLPPRRHAVRPERPAHFRVRVRGRDGDFGRRRTRRRSARPPPSSRGRRSRSARPRPSPTCCARCPASTSSRWARPAPRPRSSPAAPTRRRRSCWWTERG